MPPRYPYAAATLYQWYINDLPVALSLWKSWVQGCSFIGVSGAVAVSALNKSHLQIRFHAAAGRAPEVRKRGKTRTQPIVDNK